MKRCVPKPHGKRLVLTLLEEFNQASTTAGQETCRGIKVRTKLSEGGNFTVLGKIELEGTSKHLHDLPVRKDQKGDQYR